jgi:1-acyl-sn-glycerol-3-phosphate acyltransferase
MLYSIGYTLCRWIARTLFSLRVEGEAHIPEEGAAILAPNHVSFLDSVVVGVSAPRPVYFMAKKELFGNPLARWFLNGLHAFPVSREQIAASTLRHTLALLHSGEAVVIFPEGGRGDGRTMRPIRPGVGLIAARSGAPVIPVCHSGTERALPRGARWIRRAALRVRFGPPLRFAGHGAADHAAMTRFAREIGEAIAALRVNASLPIE